MSISALQEFNSLLAPISTDGAENNTPTITPLVTPRCVSARGEPSEQHLGESEDNALFNSSLAMSEVSEISCSTVRTEEDDTLISEVSLEPKILNRRLGPDAILFSLTFDPCLAMSGQRDIMFYSVD